MKNVKMKAMKKKNKKKKTNRRLILVRTKIIKGLLVAAAIIIAVLSCICISRNRSTDDPLENLDSRIMAELAKNGIDVSRHDMSEGRCEYYYKIDEEYSSVFEACVTDNFKDDDLRTDYQPLLDAIKYVDNITEIYIYSGEDNYCDEKSWNDARVIFYMEFKANGHECRVINIKEVIGIEDGCLNWQNQTYYYSGEIPISLESVHDFSYDHERPVFYYQKDDYGNEISFDGDYEINGFIDNNKLYIRIESMGIEFGDDDTYKINTRIRLNDEKNYEAQHFFGDKVSYETYKYNFIHFEDFNDDGYADFEMRSNRNGDGIRFYWSHDGQCYESE